MITKYLPQASWFPVKKRKIPRVAYMLSPMPITKGAGRSPDERIEASRPGHLWLHDEVEKGIHVSHGEEVR